MVFLRPVFLLLSLALLLKSCADAGVGNVPEVQGDSGYTFSESLEEWQNLKEEKGSSYEYTIIETSWTGIEKYTTLVVRNDEVVSRDFRSIQRDPNTGEEEPLESFSETGENIGTHEKGAEAKTLDQLYESCATEYLNKDPDSHTLYFDTDEAGILNLCGSVENSCVDDCFTGLTLANFSWL